MPPIPTGPFTMPMMNGFVPKKIQPWIYVLFAFCFQLAGGMYAGAMPHVMGDMCIMREDVTMIVLCGVIGVNMPFPFLFRFSSGSPTVSSSSLLLLPLLYATGYACTQSLCRCCACFLMWQDSLSCAERLSVCLTCSCG